MKLSAIFNVTCYFQSFQPPSHITRQAQYNHPCLTSCYLYTNTDQPIKPVVIPGPAHTQFQPHSSLVPANPYLMEEIPPWLLVYVNGGLFF